MEEFAATWKIEISVQNLDKTDSKSVIIEVKVNCNWNLQKWTPDKHFQRVKISFEDSITFYLQNILQNLKGVSETARKVGKKKKNYIFLSHLNIFFVYIYEFYFRVNSSGLRLWQAWNREAEKIDFLRNIGEKEKKWKRSEKN